MRKQLKTILISIFFGLNLFSFSAVWAQDSRDEALNDERSILDKKASDVQVYTLAESHYAFGLRAAIHGFPNASALGDIYQFYAEWILPYQKAGLFSVGGTFGVFAMRELKTAFPYPNYLNTLSGAQIRYQLKFTPNQVLVPTASLEYMYYRLKQPNNNYLSGTNIGTSLGVFLNLGWIDTMTARSAYEGMGLSKMYLTLELRPASFSNEAFQLNGSFLMFGLRSEFE